MHIHVRRDADLAKFWVSPLVALADSYGFNAQELREIQRVIEDNRSLIEERWHAFFG